MSEQKWRLVPVEATADMKRAMFSFVGWPRVLTAAPPMPRAVFDAMVERTAWAIARTIEQRNGNVTGGWMNEGRLAEAEAALRAALPGLRVEGDGE